MSDNTIPEEIQKLAKILKEEVSMGDHGTIDVNKEAFEKTLPEDLTIDTIVNVQNHRDDVMAALGLVVGEMSIEAMKKDPNLKQVSASMPIHKDTLSSTFQRERQIPNADGGTSTTYGIVRSTLNCNGAANKGNYKKVKTLLSKQAKEAFSG